jgi:hypothetical protein
VLWLPTTASLTTAETPGASPFVYDPDDGLYHSQGGVSTPYANFNDPGLSIIGTGSLAPTAMLPYHEAMFDVLPTVNTGPARASRVDFSVTEGGRTIMLPFFLRQEGVPPLYAFSEGGATLTLFANFPLESNLSGLNKTNIQELNTTAIAAGVKTLVIKGNSFTAGQLRNIDARCGPGNLLSGLTAISLPDFTGTIPNNCFTDGNQTPTALWLLNFSAPKVTTIGNQAFYGSNLESIDLSEATTIGEEAFCDSDGLTNISLPNVTTIKQDAFYRCSNLTNIYLPEAKTIGPSSFAECKLTNVTLPKATKIEEQAFSHCSILASVDLPKATTIEDYTFSYCPLLTTVRLGATSISLGIYIFEGTTIMSNITLHLKTNVSPALPAPGTLPMYNANWNGYIWTTIVKYQ